MADEPKCLGRFNSHSWGDWSLARGEGRFWRYTRECNLMGCDGQEWAHELVACGPVFDRDGIRAEISDPELPKQMSWDWAVAAGVELRVSPDHPFHHAHDAAQQLRQPNEWQDRQIPGSPRPKGCNCGCHTTMLRPCAECCKKGG